MPKLIWINVCSKDSLNDSGKYGRRSLHYGSLGGSEIGGTSDPEM